MTFASRKQLGDDTKDERSSVEVVTGVKSPFDRTWPTANRVQGYIYEEANHEIRERVGVGRKGNETGRVIEGERGAIRNV